MNKPGHETPNVLLRETRVRLFGTQQALADAANQHLAPAYLMTGNDIGKLERGIVSRPSAPRRDALRIACRVSTDAELGFGTRSPMLTTTRPLIPSEPSNDQPEFAAPAAGKPSTGTLATTHSELGETLPFLRDQWHGLADARMGYGISSRVETPSPDGDFPQTHKEETTGRSPTPFFSITSPVHFNEVVSHLHEQWHALVRADNLLGPRAALAGVLNQIGVARTLTESLRGDQRLEVVRLGGKYAESAAWLYEEVGSINRAAYWTDKAMEWAYEGGDERLLSWAAFRRAQQAAAAGHTAQAIGLTGAARRNEGILANPTRAAIRVQEAYAYALDGDELTSQRLLDEAHPWAANDTAGDARDGHGSYCTPAFIEIQRARCLSAVGKPKQAITLYENGIRTLSPVYQRNRTTAQIQLALAYAADLQFERAAATAHAVLPAARGIGSPRILAEVHAVGGQIMAHHSLEEVAALLAELRHDDSPSESR